MKKHLANVRDYYESTYKEYRILWTGNRELAMHFGYFDETVRNHSESLLRMNEKVAELAQIKSSDKVLDAGCGFGGSSIWLAEHIGCHVTGITIVPSQITKAEKYAKKYGVAEKATFALEDFSNTSFPDRSFDVIFGIESIVHADSKDAFIKEANRLLKPGGRLAIVEYTLRDAPPLTLEEKRLIKPWLDGWEMPSLLTVSEYTRLCKKYGFTNISDIDITKQTLPSFYRLERFSNLFGIGFVTFFMKLGLLNKKNLGNRLAAEAGINAMKTGRANYSIILAQKPTK